MPAVRFPETLTELIHPEVILPTQTWPQFPAQVQPERQLMLAVLADAIGCFLKYRFSTSYRSQRRFREAEAWLMFESKDGPFSFESICDTLGLDPSYLRRGLRLWHDHRLKPPTTEPSAPHPSRWCRRLSNARSAQAREKSHEGDGTNHI